MSNVNKIFKSSSLLIIESVSKKLVGLVSTLILARLLTPEDFGIVAIATLAFGFIEVFSITGSQQYIITTESINEKVLNTAFTFDILMKSIAAFAFACSTPWIADYYNDQRLIPVLLISSFMLLIQGLRNPQIAVLKRNQEYSKIVKMTVFCKVISTITAISIALITESYWALIGGQFIAYTMPVIGGYIIAPYKPKFTFVNIKEQFSFSGWLIPSSILGYFRTQIDTILVSKFFDTAVLGSYHVMKYLAFIPSMYIVGPITQPLLAQLSSVKNNQSYFSKMFNVSLLVTLAIALPISHLIFYYADIIIVAFLGDQWGDYSELFSLFGLMVFFTAIFHHANNCFLMFNNTRMSFLFELCAVIIIGVGLSLLNFEQPYEFAAIKIAIEIFLSLTIFIYTAIRFTNLKHFFIASIFTVALIAFSICSIYISEYLIGKPESFIELIITITIYFVLYFSLISGGAYALRNRFNELNYLVKLFHGKLLLLIRKENIT